MGTNQFQREYIEYLQERNTELLKKLNHMKENYENKIFSKDLSKPYIITALEDILKVCTVLPKEIDSFFDKITGAMEILKNILIKKSEMVQLTEKISQAINQSENFRENLVVPEDVGFLKGANSDAKTDKRGGMAKISPMINGHVISTEPRICLNRISDDFTPGRRNELYQLSPIVEVSPNTSLESLSLEFSKELRIPLERINFNTPPYICINMNSSKNQFKGPKTWKEMVKNQQADPQNIIVEEPEHLNGKPESIEQHKATENEEDPLEGPSWLYNKNSSSVSPPNIKLHTFVDCRPRKHRFAAVFDPKAQSPKAKKNYVSMPDNLNESECGETNGEEINEASKDYARESCMEEKENDLSSENNMNLTYRKYVEDSSDDNEFSEFVAGVKKQMSTPYSKITENRSPVKSDSFYKAGCEEKLSTGKTVNKSYGKRNSRSIFDEVSIKTSPKIQRSPESRRDLNYVEEEKVLVPQKRKGKNSKGKSGKKSSKKENTMKEVNVELSNCKTSIKVSRSKTNSDEGKKTNSREERGSGSPEGGRATKKRKAAPTNLREPPLMGKLRRE